MIHTVSSQALLNALFRTTFRVIGPSMIMRLMWASSRDTSPGFEFFDLDGETWMTIVNGAAMLGRTAPLAESNPAQRRPCLWQQ